MLRISKDIASICYVLPFFRPRIALVVLMDDKMSSVMDQLGMDLLCFEQNGNYKPHNLKEINQLSL